MQHPDYVGAELEAVDEEADLHVGAEREQQPIMPMQPTPHSTSPTTNRSTP